MAVVVGGVLLRRWMGRKTDRLGLPAVREG